MKNTHEQGYTVLIVVLMISAAVLVVVLALSSLGINETLISADDQQSEKSFQIAEACTDEAIIRLNRSFNGEEGVYSGGTLNFGTDSCTIGVVVAGSNRQVDVVSTVNGKINRKIQVIVQMSPSFSVLSWQEQ